MKINKKNRNRSPKLCLISSSGGHFEQINNLKVLSKDFEIYFVTEKTKYSNEANYFLPQTGMRDLLFPVKMAWNSIKSLYIWIKEKPDVVISTGTMVALPTFLLAKMHKKKIIYIETFARINDGTRAGKLMYKYADLFIVQWPELLQIYPNAEYGGSLY